MLSSTTVILGRRAPEAQMVLRPEPQAPAAGPTAGRRRVLLGSSGADTERADFLLERTTARSLETDIMGKCGIVERDASYSGINAIVFTECIFHTHITLELGYNT